MVAGPVFAIDSLDERVNKKFYEVNSESPKIGLTIRNNQRTSPERNYNSVYLPIRTVFGDVAEISWDHKTKTAYVMRGEEQLVFSQDPQFVSSDIQVVWPTEWLLFKDGRMMIHFLYLAYLFDRYEEFQGSSDESQWREKLSFLGISYIDNTFGFKDQTLHSFIEYD